MGAPLAGRRPQLHRHRPVRVAPEAGQPDRRTDGLHGFRVVPDRACPGQLPCAVHAQPRARRSVGRRVPAPRPELSVGAARARVGPRARHRRVPDLHRRLGAGAAVRRLGGSRMRRVPGQRVSGTPRRRAGERVPGGRGHSLRGPVHPRARPARTAAEAHRHARAAPAHAGVRVRAVHVPGRDGRDRRSRGRRAVAGVRCDRAAPARLPGGPAAQPHGRAGRGAARVARPARHRVRHRAPAARARPPRRRPGATGRARHAARSHPRKGGSRSR